MFEVPFEAAIGEAAMIARDNVAAIRKNVLAKCYGGEYSQTQTPRENKKKAKSA